MKTNFFLKQSYSGYSVKVLYLYIVFALIPLFANPPLKAYKLIALFILNTAFAGMLHFITKQWGLYICRGDVYYKTLRERRIDVQEIAGVKIMPTYYYSKFSHGVLKDSQGSPCYSVTLLRSLQEEMYTYEGSDADFQHDLHRNVICSAVYGKEAVEYLLHLNPNIEIIM